MIRAVITAMLFAAACSFASGDPPDPEIRASISKASKKIMPVRTKAAGMLVDGKSAEATQMLLDTFPEASRTAVEAMVLGNVLYKSDPELSYALHKRAAAELAGNPDAQLEWAMEQQRAKEYEGAWSSYDVYIRAHPTKAPIMGLAAECLIRNGRVKEAVDMWIRSEKAPDGSLEDLETIVCEVHGPLPRDKERSALLAGVATGSIEAAEALIAMDISWTIDWWNTVVNTKYLEHDLRLVRASPLPAGPRLQAVLCLGECGMVEEPTRESLTPILERFGFFVDKDTTLPETGRVLSLMLSNVVDPCLNSRAVARERFGERVLAQARRTRDVESYKTAGYLFMETDRLAEIDAEGWAATKDRRFAESMVWNSMRMQGDKFRPDDPKLAPVIEANPDSATIAMALVLTATKNKLDPEPYLVRAIKAEYLHFSLDTLYGVRLSARPLRGHFLALKSILDSRGGGQGARP